MIAGDIFYVLRYLLARLSHSSRGGPGLPRRIRHSQKRITRKTWVRFQEGLGFPTMWSIMETVYQAGSWMFEIRNKHWQTSSWLNPFVFACDNPIQHCSFEPQNVVPIDRLPTFRVCVLLRLNMTGLTSIRISGDSKIEIVNQLLLPHSTEFIEIDNIQQAHDAIKTMKVCFTIRFASSTCLNSIEWN